MNFILVFCIIPAIGVIHQLLEAPYSVQMGKPGKRKGSHLAITIGESPTVQTQCQVSSLSNTGDEDFDNDIDNNYSVKGDNNRIDDPNSWYGAENEDKICD